MARTKSVARKARNAPRDVIATGEAINRDKKKKNKAKIKAKAKAKQEAKLRAANEKKARKAAAAAAAGNDDDESSVNTGDDSVSVEEEEDDGFIHMDAEDAPGRNRLTGTESGAAGAEDGEEVDDSSGRLMHESMPWMGNRKGYFSKNLFAALHEEILDFVRFMSPTPAEVTARTKLIEEMEDLVASLWADSSLDTFGSHRTQMFLPNSDIDLVIFGVEKGTKPLFELAEKLEELDLVSYLEVIDKARIPIVKFVHKATNIQVDVSFNVSSGLATADLVRHYMRVYPAFRPLVLVLKYFLAQRGLNETFAGGIGSFLLQLMVVSFLQQHRRKLGAEHDHPHYNNLGYLLVEFFTLYGRDWNYNDLGVSVRNGGFYFYKEDQEWYDGGRPFLLSMENPNEPDLDVGKNSYDIRTIKRSFEYARQVLINEIHRRGQFHPLAGSILGTIIPADSHLLEREGPETMGFEILYHDPKQTSEIRRQYEERRDEEARKKAAEAAVQRQAQQQRKQNSGNEPPAKRWRGRNSRIF